MKGVSKLQLGSFMTASSTKINMASFGKYFQTSVVNLYMAEISPENYENMQQASAFVLLYSTYGKN